MRILFLSGWYPYPPDNGSKIRIYNLVRRLARCCAIHLLSFTDDPVSEDQLAAMKKYCSSVDTVPWIEFRPARLRAFLGFLSPRPRAVVDTYSLTMQDRVTQMAQWQPFDVVVASEFRTAPYAARLSCPRIFEDPELSVLHERYAAAQHWLTRARHGLTWWKMSRYMSRLLDQFDACTVVSEGERDLLASIAPDYTHVAVAPNGVDVEHYTGFFGAPQPGSMIYTGALSYHANFDAMDYFLSEVHPLIAAQEPRAALAITGRADPALMQRLPKAPEVTFTGYLPDIRPAIAQSWISIVPLRVGGGTRLKILEAMALGTPVVSTRKGAEGLDVTHEQDILVADTPNAFADAVLRLFNDRALRARLASNGRQLVKRMYDWDVCAEVLVELIQRVAGDG